jgi:hypothetical protein
MADPKDFLEGLLERRIRNGAVYISDDDRRRYVIEHLNEARGSMTLRRETPKARGKAARRRARHQRRHPQQERRMNDHDAPETPAPAAVPEDSGNILSTVNEVRLAGLEKNVAGLLNLVYHLEDTIKQKEQLDQERHQEALLAITHAIERVKFPHYSLSIRLPFSGRIVRFALLEPEVP